MDKEGICILQVSCGGLGIGGVQKVIMDIKRNINCKKSDVVLFTNERKQYDDEFESLNGTIYRIPIKNRPKLLKLFFSYVNLIFIYRRMCQIFKENRYNVIHCHNGYESGVILKAAKKFNVKVRISHLHGSEYDSHCKWLYHYRNMLRKMVTKNSTNIICCSDNAKKSFYGDLNLGNIIILPNAVDINYYSSIPKIKSAELTLTNVGTYSYNKNQLFLIEIAKKLEERNKNFKLYLIGYGDFEQKLIERIKAYNLNNVFLVNGLIEDKINYLKSTDLFLFPSQKEGYPIALLEAQAMGIKCIASNTITQEVNLGLVSYLENDNVDIWVESIINYNKDTNVTISKEILGKYDVKYFCKSISEIYGV